MIPHQEEPSPAGAVNVPLSHESRNSIADIWGARTPYAGEWPERVDEATVDRLLEAREALPFAPSGRRFREWASIPVTDHQRWEGHLHDALEASVRRRRH